MAARRETNSKTLRAPVDQQLKDAQALPLEFLPRCVRHAADIVQRTQDDRVRLDGIKWLASIAGMNTQAHPMIPCGHSWNAYPP